MTQEAINIYNEGYYHYTGANGRPETPFTIITDAFASGALPSMMHRDTILFHKSNKKNKRPLLRGLFLYSSVFSCVGSMFCKDGSPLCSPHTSISPFSL